MKNKILYFWNNLAWREKLLITIVSAFLVPIFIFYFLLSPIIDLGNEAQNDYLKTKQDLIDAQSNLNSYQKLKQVNRLSNFNFQELLTKIVLNIGIIEQPTINQEKLEVFGTNYVLRFNGLRTDQIFRLIYYLENNVPPVIVSKFEAVSAIQSQDLSSLTLIIKTE